MSRPGVRTGARIETCITPPKFCAVLRRPGVRTGARIETANRLSGLCCFRVAPVSAPGRGLKQHRYPHNPDVIRSPRCPHRGAD